MSQQEAGCPKEIFVWDARESLLTVHVPLYHYLAAATFVMQETRNTILCVVGKSELCPCSRQLIVRTHYFMKTLIWAPCIFLHTKKTFFGLAIMRPVIPVSPPVFARQIQYLCRILYPFYYIAFGACNWWPCLDEDSIFLPAQYWSDPGQGLLSISFWRTFGSTSFSLPSMSLLLKCCSLNWIDDTKVIV